MGGGLVFSGDEDEETQPLGDSNSSLYESMP